MNPIFKLLDDAFIMQIYFAVLKKEGSMYIVKFYDNYLLKHISVRKSNEQVNEKAILTINSDLTVEFNEQEINVAERNNVISFLNGSGFPAKMK